MSDLEKEVEAKQRLADLENDVAEELEAVDAEIEKLHRNIRNSEIMAVILGAITVLVLVARMIA